MPMLNIPEKSAIATSVASGASDSTRACSNSPKHMIAIPQTTVSVPSIVASPDSGNSISKQTARVPMAVINRPFGNRSLNRLNTIEPMIPAPPKTSSKMVVISPLRRDTVCVNGSM